MSNQADTQIFARRKKISTQVNDYTAVMATSIVIFIPYNIIEVARLGEPFFLQHNFCYVYMVLCIKYQVNLETLGVQTFS